MLEFYGTTNEINTSGIFYEQITVKGNTGAYTLHDVQGTADHTGYPKHCHNAIEVLYPKGNRIEMFINGETFILNENEVIFINPMTIHSLKASDDSLCVDTWILHIDPKKASLLHEDIASWQFVEKPVKEGVQQIMDLFVACDNEELQQKGYLLLLYAKCRELGILQKKSTKISDQMIDILNYVNDHFREDLSPYMLADVFHLSYGYFARMFKENMGIAFSQYLADVRLKEALWHLRHTDSSISDIAMDSGFADERSLIRECRKKTNMTPKQYRSVYR